VPHCHDTQIEMEDKLMSYDGWRDFDFEVDIKQDIETYIDWDVDTKFTVDIKKDIDIKVDVDVDVKDQGSVITAVVKDFGGGWDYDPKASSGDGGGDGPSVVVIGDTMAIEDVLSTADLKVQTENTVAQLSAGAFDRSAVPDFAGDWGYFDSATFTEINLGIDHVEGKFSIVTLDMQSLVDG